MPLEQLEKLFEEIGQAAERLGRLRGQGEAAFGGRVAQSESIHSIADLYAQLGRDQTLGVIKPMERLVEQLKELNERLAAQEKKADAAGPASSVWRRWHPRHFFDQLLQFSNTVATQEAAGRPVPPWIYGTAWASRFFYSFATGRVVMPSGRAIPWRRALAARLRGRPWARPIRRILLAPDIMLRQLRAFAGGPTAASAASRLAAAAGAGAAGAGGAGAAGAGGAGAAGAAGLGAASVLGVAAGIIVTFAAALILGTVALGKFVGAIRESASASLEAKRQYAELVPAMAAVLSRKDVFEMQETARRGRMLAPLAQAELATYQRWTERTRSLELLGATITTGFKIALQEAIINHPVFRAIEQIANWIVKKFGLEDEQKDISAALRAFQIMRRGEAEITMGQQFFHWPRSRPPKPINMGPGEK